MIRRLLAALVLTSCAHSTSDMPPADAAAPAPDATAPDNAPSGWAAVDSVVAARAAANGAPQVGLIVWDRNDHKVHESMLGGFTSGTRVVNFAVNLMLELAPMIKALVHR